jgi:hypothetical protein
MQWIALLALFQSDGTFQVVPSVSVITTAEPGSTPGVASSITSNPKRPHAASVAKARAETFIAPEATRSGAQTGSHAMTSNDSGPARCENTHLRLGSQRELAARGPGDPGGITSTTVGRYQDCAPAIWRVAAFTRLNRFVVAIHRIKPASARASKCLAAS